MSAHIPVGHVRTASPPSLGIAPQVEARARRRVARLLLGAAIGYTCFVIYGSLVPLHFQRQSLEAAWAYFQQIPYLDLGIGSRADWVANILLFVPLAYLWVGVLWPRRVVGRLIVIALVLAVAAGLSAAIEFTQIFFPPRTVSLNDIVAECIGAVIGVAAWCAFGKATKAWLTDWVLTHTQASLPKRLLFVYLFLLFGYNVMPLDLTISAVEIFHKWREGKVLLIPFSANYGSPVRMAYALAADTAIWIPAAVLWKVASGRSAGRVIVYVVGSATLIELLQIFVYSRVTSVTDVIMATVGGMIGVAIAGMITPAADASLGRRSATGGGRVAWWVLAFLGWTAVLMVVFWYPFDFRTEWGFVHERIAKVKRVPFEAYYYGTEFRAITEVFHKTGFFFPFGGLLAVATRWLEPRLPTPRMLFHVAAVTLICGMAASIELGQLFLPARSADGTDWFLESLGGLLGYACVLALLGHRRAEPA
ncbi:MAG: VanZ family protein [Casimicrobiaceae bacterium]